MRHAATKSVFAYWCELLPETVRGDAPRWPNRSAVEPAAMRAWLGDVFILQQRDGEACYRLAGTRLCALYGRELADAPFGNAFTDADRGAARSWVSTFGAEAAPLLFSSRARAASGGEVELETLVLPLHNDRDERDGRALGITTPGHRPEWLGLSPVASEEVRSVRVLRPWETGIARRDWPLVAPSIGDLTPPMNRRIGQIGQRVGLGHLRVLQGGLA